MKKSKEPRQIVENWLSQLPKKTRGNIAGALILLEYMQESFSLDISDYKAENSDQLRGASLSAVTAILEKYGETRPLSKEGGRTNRGLMKNLEDLLNLLKSAGIKNIEPAERRTFLQSMQKALAEKATNFLNSKKLNFHYKHGMTSHHAVSAILKQADKRHKQGDVAEYLVGAKLALRFPKIDIRNTSASAPDAQTGDHGDFQIDDSVFHVTVSPNSGHYEKCTDNLKNNLRPYLLVPDKVLEGARQIVKANEEIRGRVTVESIESFISQNIEELSEFSGNKIVGTFEELIDIYNSRLKVVETNLSLQIKIPGRG